MYHEFSYLEEVAEVSVAQEAPALAVPRVQPHSLLAPHQPGLHVADLLLGRRHRDLSQGHGEIPQGHLVLFML